LLKELVFALAHTQLVVEAVGCLLLFASLVSHAGNFRLDLQNFVLLLVDQLFNRLESLVSFLHAEQRLLPILKKGLLGHDDALDLDGCLLERVACRRSLLFLRDQLGLIQSLLFVEPFYLLVHGVNEMVLLFLNFF